MVRSDRTQLADTLMEDDPGIYLDLLDERDEAMQRLEAAERSAREMHIAADQFARERDELRAENERLKNVEIVSLEAEVVAHVDEIERLRAALQEIYGHATANNDGQPCCDTVVMLAKAALHPTPA
jgi:uncharacterized membrane protein YccC